MLQIVAGILSRRGTRGWLVGGTVRDGELGRFSPDVDLAVADDPAAVAGEIADILGSPWFALSERHLTYRVVGTAGHVDVAALRGGSIVEDLAQRDFTINAMARPVEGGPLIDPFGGLDDLERKTLAAVSDSIFVDDPLRLMRAVRFCHVLGLSLDPSLERLTRTQAPFLRRSAGERVAVEVALTLEAGRAGEAARAWGRLGLLAELLESPEDGTGAGFDSGTGTRPVSGNRFPATTGLLQDLDEGLERLDLWFPEQAEALERRLGLPVDGVLSRPAALRLAGILWGLPPEDAVRVGRRLKLSGAAGSLVQAAATCFERGWCTPSAFAETRSSPRAAVTWLWDAAPWEPETVLLAAAAGGHDLMADARGLMALWVRREGLGLSRPPVDGGILMRELGLTPGPLLGKVIREVRLAWEAGELATEGEALVAARALLDAE